MNDDGIILIIMLAIALGVIFGVPQISQDTVYIMVIDKFPYHGENIVVADVEIPYHGPDPTINSTFRREAFSVSEEWGLLIFDAAERYSSIEKGKHYTAKVCRYNIRPLYRNIVEVKQA